MRRFLVIIEKADKNYVAYCPDLPGCIATGADEDQAAEKMRKAVQMHIEGLKKQNITIPTPNSKYIEIDPDDPSGQKAAHIGYEKSMVIYFDILGFRDFVIKHGSNPAKIFDQIFSVRFRAIQPFGQAKTINFSDTIIVAIPLKANDERKTIRKVLSDLAELHSELAIKDMVVRGSVTIGDIYINKEYRLSPVVFGPALIRAHVLESKYAKYPRIIVDPDILSDIGANEYIRKWDDGNSFVDYLRASYQHENFRVTSTRPISTKHYLELHKEKIISNLEQYQKSADVVKKYKWVAEYHNVMIRELRDRGYIQDFLSPLTFNDLWIDLEKYGKAN